MGGRVARIHDAQPACIAPEHSVGWLERTEDLEERREHDASKNATLPPARHLRLGFPRQSRVALGLLCAGGDFVNISVWSTVL